MPSEVRRLVFSLEELMLLVSSFIKSTDTEIPRGKVMDFKIASETPLKVTLFVHAETGRQVVHDIGEIFISAAMIDYCMRNRIPISKRAQKSVKMLNGQFVLDMIQANAL